MYMTLLSLLTGTSSSTRVGAVFFLFILHVSHINCEHLQGLGFNGIKLATDLWFSPDTVLRRNDKSFRRETD